MSAEHRAKIGLALRGVPKSDAARAAMSAAKKGRPTHRSFTPEDHAKSLAARTGRALSVEHRSKLSDIKASRPPHFAKRVIDYNGTKFRSSFEVRTAKAFDALGIPWEYESKCYRLSPTQSYRPDFIVPTTGAIWEVKGYIDAKSHLKMEAFRRLYPDVPFVVATLPVILMLERAAVSAASHRRS
jgi:hypothetical protein